MKCIANTISGGMIYIPSFVKISTDVKILLGWDTQTRTGGRAHAHTHTHTHRAR
jgi:hypothetical protein